MIAPIGTAPPSPPRPAETLIAGGAGTHTHLLSITPERLMPEPWARWAGGALAEPRKVDSARPRPTPTPATPSLSWSESHALHPSRLT